MAEPAPRDTPPSDIVVELSGVWKIYRQRIRYASLKQLPRALFRPEIKNVEALRGIDLRVCRGEIVAYAGPNGAGKSTTVKLLSSLLAPDSGTVRVLGLDPIRDRTRYVSRIGVVFGQRTELWWDQPVAASFEWKRVVWNVPRSSFEGTLGFLRELLGLDEFQGSMARELSLGQRMRADLAMALLHEPEVLFLDEPTLGLDVLAKRKVLDFVKELNRARQMTVMVTSHDMTDLERLAGRIVMIDRGNIAFDGDFGQLRRSFGDRRHLFVETAATEPPTLVGAHHVRSEEHRHEYAFDAVQVRISDLLDQAAEQATIVDVETHRASIDDVIADIYQRWIDEGKAIPGR